jgi:diadenylate cyclase
MGDLWVQYIQAPIQSAGWNDIVDILLLTIILYGVYCYGNKKRTSQRIFGLVAILIMYGMTDIMHLRTTYRLLSSLVSFGIVVLVVIFQEDIQDGLTQLGTMITDLLHINNKERSDTAYAVSAVAEAACCIAQNEHDGALIVLERSAGLKDYAKKGEQLDAKVSSKLLTNIFVDRSPLHDGAVIIRGGRVVAACCKLRLSANEEVAAGLGTRHRAAIGISETCDCVVVVVSEERHIISLACNGLLKRNYNRGMEDLRDKENLKIVQNKLREDLFLLMTGKPVNAAQQDAITQEKQKQKGKGGRKYRILQVFHRNTQAEEQAAVPDGAALDAGEQSQEPQEGGRQDGQV